MTSQFSIIGKSTFCLSTFSCCWLCKIKFSFLAVVIAAMNIFIKAFVWTQRNVFISLWQTPTNGVVRTGYMFNLRHCQSNLIIPSLHSYHQFLILTILVNVRFTYCSSLMENRIGNYFICILVIPSSLRGVCSKLFVIIKIEVFVCFDFFVCLFFCMKKDMAYFSGKIILNCLPVCVLCFRFL